MNYLSERNKIEEVCLLAGKIMLQSGAETYRVEDTMIRIASFFGSDDPQSYVTPTGIIFSLHGTEKTKLLRITKRTTNLNKVIIVNNISRKISSGEISVEEAYTLLRKIEVEDPKYSSYVTTTAASIASGFSIIMLNGEWNDFLSSFIAGGAGFSCQLYLHRLVNLKFFSEFIASLVVGLLSFLFIEVGMGHDLSNIIVSSVMPLVPGLLITNAVRDIMAGHLVSGLSKGAEASFTAFAISSGIAIIFSLF
ncbi:threonine/serine exporter family protein [Neobacillus cucumis]|uniref:threonine/serine exporter family protein n=1 Tax=Neobacillus cucumis TaxID=1740721 RepID=UPI0020405C4E|nr:threonine/serine exporter family protein [Neobacillus cucumis]MCM3724640.1 threonine/serine exporter family protein [Neobacillus cucumis]